jgi:hypothetical protein
VHLTLCARSQRQPRPTRIHYVRHCEESIDGVRAPGGVAQRGHADYVVRAMRAILSLIVIAVVSGCDSKTMSTASGLSNDGAGGESWSTHDAASGGDWDLTASGGAGAITASGGAHGPAPDAATKVDAMVPLPACPDLTTVVDGGSEACIGSRTYLVCLALSGAGQTCPSDNASHCPPGPFMVSGPLACRDECEPTEFAVSCGGGAFGLQPKITLPPECREINGRDGVGYCCPCGS